MSVYSDYPECLIRYAWLLETGVGLFTSRDERSRCKACGLAVPPSLHATHRREELRELKRVRTKRARELRAATTRRMRELRRLRAESRRVYE